MTSLNFQQGFFVLRLAPGEPSAAANGFLAAVSMEHVKHNRDL